MAQYALKEKKNNRSAASIEARARRQEIEAHRAELKRINHGIGAREVRRLASGKTREITDAELEQILLEEKKAKEERNQKSIESLKKATAALKGLGEMSQAASARARQGMVFIPLDQRDLPEDNVPIHED